MPPKKSSKAPAVVQDQAPESQAKKAQGPPVPNTNQKQNSVQPSSEPQQKIQNQVNPPKKVEKVQQKQAQQLDLQIQPNLVPATNIVKNIINSEVLDAQKLDEEMKLFLNQDLSKTNVFPIVNQQIIVNQTSNSDTNFQSLTHQDKKLIRMQRFGGLAQKNLDTKQVADLVLEEKQKRLQRAMKFGIETKELKQEKIKERMARFNLSLTKNGEVKQINNDEELKRKKRLERFNAENQQQKEQEKQKRQNLEFTLDEYKSNKQLNLKNKKFLRVKSSFKKGNKLNLIKKGNKQLRLGVNKGILNRKAGFKTRNKQFKKFQINRN